ncbi:MAG: hypothetical protein ABL930_12180 [Pseudobdellovibrio sp.]
MPYLQFPYGKNRSQNRVTEYLESQNCIEEGTNDRLATNKVLTGTARDAALTVFSLGLGSIPMLAKLGLSTRLISTIRIGGEVIDISANVYFASTEWRNATKSCTAENAGISSSERNSCSKNNSALNTQMVSAADCRLEATMAALATLSLGMQFVRSESLLRLRPQNNFSAEQVLKNSRLENAARVAELERINGLPKGVYANNPTKVSAILAAHSLAGTTNNLTFAQIRSRVSLLRRNGFSRNEIKRGLDAGIFGNTTGSIVSRPAISSEGTAQVSSLLNESLANAKVLSKIDDISTKSRSFRFHR